MCKPHKDERVKGKPEADPVSVRRKLQEPTCTDAQVEEEQCFPD